jgi:hypothetical protein
MKNIQIFLILCLIIFSFSQVKASSVFGVKMGIVTSKFELKIQSFDPSGNVTHYNTFFNQNRIGPTMGIYFRYYDFKFFNFESELYYLQKGGQEKMPIRTLFQPEGTREYIINDFQFDYLKIQFNLRPNYTFERLDLYGILGISLNYLLSVKNGLTPKESFRDFGYSYSFGTGIEITELINHSFLVEFIINSDIKNIYKDSSQEYKFQTFLIRIGFGIIQ